MIETVFNSLKQRTKGLYFLGMLLLMLCCTGIAQAEDSVTLAYTMQPEVQVLASPQSDTVVGIIPLGTQVDILSVKGDWAQVEVDGVALSGFVERGDLSSEALMIDDASIMNEPALLLLGFNWQNLATEAKAVLVQEHQVVDTLQFAVPDVSKQDYTYLASLHKEISMPDQSIVFEVCLLPLSHGVRGESILLLFEDRELKLGPAVLTRKDVSDYEMSQNFSLVEGVDGTIEAVFVTTSYRQWHDELERYLTKKIEYQSLNWHDNRHPRVVTQKP